MPIVEHTLRGPICYGMIIPFGSYKNAHLMEAEIGEICETVDDPPRLVMIVARSKISVHSSIANTLSVYLYGMPMLTAFRAMKRNWRSEIDDDEALFLVVQEIKPHEMDYNIAHTFAPEIYIPWVAINDNLQFITDNEPIIVTGDMVEAKVIERREIHVLSSEGAELIRRLYNLSLDPFLKRWYAKYPHMTSLGFVYFKLEKIDGRTETEVVPGADD